MRLSPLRIESLRPIAISWIAVSAVAYIAYLWSQTRAGLSDGSGGPFGDDFINYWSGAFLAWHQRAGDVYDWNAFHAFQDNLTGASLDFFHYSYPPVLLLLTAPLALIPYVPALACWLAASSYAFYRALSLAMPGGSVALFAFATPALFLNTLGGQNGAWTAALFGGGLCLLERRPVVAGIFFGLLSYKPQLGLLLPFALLAGRHWRALFAAAATVLVLVGLNFAVFGPDVWTSYMRNVSFLRATILEDGTGVWHRMVSMFVLVRQLTGDVWLAYGVQIASALIAGVLVVRAWWNDAPAPVRNSLLILGTCLSTPYLQDYDLLMLAFVVAWIVALCPRDPMDWQLPAPVAIACGLLLVAPLVAGPFGILTGYALGPLLLLPAFVLLLRGLPAGRSWDRLTPTPVRA